jgi:hypothetical protein
MTFGFTYGQPAAQAALDRDSEQATAPRDYAARKAIDAFRRFEAGARASKDAAQDHNFIKSTIRREIARCAALSSPGPAECLGSPDPSLANVGMGGVAASG